VDILFLLIPLSVVLVFALMGVFAWALQANQFDDLSREGTRILDDEPDLDEDQASP
jgi:cbb3-type cytochrome oxidase maturation protein